MNDRSPTQHRIITYIEQIIDYIEETTMNHLDDTDSDRLTLLDPRRTHTRDDLAEQSIEWTTLDDGSEALLVNGGGVDGGSGAYFANAGDDVHAVGSLEPLVEGYVGCIVIWPDRSRVLAQVMPDPLGPPSE